MSNRTETKYRLSRIRDAEKNREYSMPLESSTLPTLNYVVGLFTGLFLGSAITAIVLFSLEVL